MDDKLKLETNAKEIRKKIFLMIYKAGGGHITPAFSIVELLTVIYFKILRIDPKHPRDPNRDRFILSKGHASAALYATLAQAGFIEEGFLETFCQPSGKLGGHPDIDSIPGVEATTGALGHGFPFSIGIALSGKLDKKNYRVYTVIGDGECQEGSVWEAAQFAAHHQLDNLTAIIDYNKLQAMGKISEILGLEPLVKKWESFNWAVREVDGHDLKEINRILSSVPFEKNKPSLIVAHTIKGKGVSFMENVPIWHYRLTNEKETEISCQELGIESLTKGF